MALFLSFVNLATTNLKTVEYMRLLRNVIRNATIVSCFWRSTSDSSFLSAERMIKAVARHHAINVFKIIDSSVTMLSISTVLFWSLLTVEFVFSQFLSPPSSLTSASTDSGSYAVRYKEVPPGICEQREDLKSISGYVDVSANEHIFFWFFEARDQDPTTAPLTTWINGGPGTSSMVGLFQEIGPCSINSYGNAIDNPYSWTNGSNLLFIDQPVQTGFSYTTTTPGYINPNNGYILDSPDGTCPSQGVTAGTCGTYSNPNDLSEIPVSTSAAASAFYATLQGFMGIFPEYARKGFHFATGQWPNLALA